MSARRRRTKRLVLLAKYCPGVMVLSLFLFTGAEAGVSFTPITIDNPELQDSSTRFGLSVALVGDINNDGTPDIAVGAPFQDTGPPLPESKGTPLNVGKIFIFSGSDRSFVRGLDDPRFEQFSKFGRVAGIGDVNGDGVPDIFTSSYFTKVVVAGVEITGAGQAFVFSGADGSVIRTLDDPTPQMLAKFGCYVYGPGDVNGDGVPDLITSAPFKDIGGLADVGQAFIFSGAGGSLMNTLINPTPLQGARFGLFIGNAGDVNGDSISDILLGAPGQDRVFVFSATDGSVIRTINHPFPQAQGIFGRKLVGGKDVTGDGMPDILVSAPLQDVGGKTDQGQAYLFSGADGSLIRTIDNPTPQAFAQFGQALAMTEDVNGDGRPELVVGAPDQDVGGIINVGQVFVFSGADGSLLYTLDDPAPQYVAGFGFAVAAGDVNSDGVPDLLVAAPFQDVLHPVDLDLHLEQGQVVLFLSSVQNDPPLANAGPDQIVSEGDLVTLDRTGSSDPNGDPLTFSWKQIAGPTVTLNNKRTPTPTFTAPAVDADTVLTYGLRVSDGSLSSTDNVTVTVRNTP